MYAWNWSGFKAIAAKKSSRRGLVSPLADSHHAAVDQHDVTLRLAETELRRPLEVVFRQVELAHFSFGEALQGDTSRRSRAAGSGMPSARPGPRTADAP